MTPHSDISSVSVKIVDFYTSLSTEREFSHAVFTLTLFSLEKQKMRTVLFRDYENIECTRGLNGVLWHS